MTKLDRFLQHIESKSIYNIGLIPPEEEDDTGLDFAPGMVIVSEPRGEWPPLDAYWQSEEHALRMVRLYGDDNVHFVVILPDGSQYEMLRDDYGYLDFWSWPADTIYKLNQKQKVWKRSWRDLPILDNEALEALRFELDGPEPDIL